MDMLSRLDSLMAQHDLNKSQLSALSGIPYTTIAGLYSKGYENVKLGTLRRLADFFDVSIEHLVGANETTPTDHMDQLRLLLSDLLERPITRRQAKGFLEAYKHILDTHDGV